MLVRIHNYSYKYYYELFFKSNFVSKGINNVKLLNKNGVIIIHRHKNEKDIFPKNFTIIEEKIYGISKIIFLSCLN